MVKVSLSYPLSSLPTCLLTFSKHSCRWVGHGFPLLKPHWFALSNALSTWLLWGNLTPVENYILSAIKRLRKQAFLFVQEFPSRWLLENSRNQDWKTLLRCTKPSSSKGLHTNHTLNKHPVLCLPFMHLFCLSLLPFNFQLSKEFHCLLVHRLLEL